ncbi:MAG: helicase-related protein, partial [Limosilactobacillus mucosae]
ISYREGFSKVHKIIDTLLCPVRINFYYLVSLKAGGTGLNLTSADTVLFFDPWWNAAVEDQAIGRAHRMGQKHVVSVYRLIAKGTIEEKILAMQEQKRQLAQDLLSGSQVANAKLTKQDLIKILD